jgi:prepilin-type N-terminal cleavage/methylation domain-containing protein
MGKYFGNKGFSLVELLIGMAIMVILLAAIAGLLSAGLSATRFNLSKGHILAPGRNAINQITDHIRYATSVTTPTAGGNGGQISYADAGGNFYTISRDSATQSVVIAKNSVTLTTLAAGMVKTLNFVREDSTVDGGNGNLKPIIKVTITIELNDHAYTGSPETKIIGIVIMQNIT